MAPPRGDQPRVPVVPRQELGEALHQGARPSLQVLHPGVIRHSGGHGGHPTAHREAVS